ncbi:MAG: nucleoside-diphosphate-sugar epimerase [Parvicella sp.]|jgi:nucleoside-diphosphate-sugar epimerase
MNLQVRNVIIFGGSGFIGTHFQSYLNNEDEIEVHSFDLRPQSGSKMLDVRGRIDIKGEFTSDDIIINLAAVHTTPGHPDHEYFETNMLGAKNVCAFAERVGIDNIIFTSSIAPYGASEDQKTEDTLPMPNTPYGISKLVAEHIHKEWAAKDKSRRLMILRPGVVFGKGENGNFTRLASAISKGIFFYPGRKDTIKACIYVKELVHQAWTLFNKQEESAKTYNVAYEPAFTIEQIASAIAKVQGKKAPDIVMPSMFLNLIAIALRVTGIGNAIGIHPDRVKKLMNSTNISGEQLRKRIGRYRYNFEEALADWYQDCDSKGLF